MIVKLDMMQTAALAAIIFYFGGYVKSKVPILYKFCIPDPVVGGLIFAAANLVFRQSGMLNIEMDTTLQSPFMMIFFTSIGFTASIELIKRGGLQVVIFWLCAVVLCVIQCGIGVTLAKILNQNPLLGLVTGSVTMTGGHGTGAAFAPLLEDLGLNGAMTAAMAAATFGLVAGSLIGGPIGRFLIERNHLQPHPEKYDLDFVNGNGDEKLSYDSLMKNFAFLLAAIGLGAVLANFFKRHGITLPAYVSSMIIAAIILNLGHFTQKWTINQKAVETIGAIGLNMFLSLALINLRLWELLDLAAPMLVILMSQTFIMAVYAMFVAYNLCGRDYDSAVITAGFCGFGLGATPNAMANMRSVVERFGEAPRAFFVVPIVGAFLIDFANAIVITTFINYIS